MLFNCDGFVEISFHIKVFYKKKRNNDKSLNYVDHHQSNVKSKTSKVVNTCFWHCKTEKDTPTSRCNCNHPLTDK